MENELCILNLRCSRDDAGVPSMRTGQEPCLLCCGSKDLLVTVLCEVGMGFCHLAVPVGSGRG